MRSRFLKRYDFLTVCVLSSFFSLLGLGRAWLLWNTGVIVSDEYGYIASAWYGQTGNAVLSYRYAFAELNIWLFRSLSLGNMERAMGVFPFYIALWSIITVISVWSLLKLLGFRPSTIALTLIFFAVTPAFLFLSAAFFTEGMSLAFASAGVYFLVRSFKRPDWPAGPLSAVVSSALLWTAMRAREPYSLLFLCAFLVVLSQVAASPENRWKLVKIALVFLIIGAATIPYPIHDPVSNEAFQSVQLATQNVVVRPLLALFFPPHVQPGANTSVTQTTTSTSSTGGGGGSQTSVSYTSTPTSSISIGPSGTSTSASTTNSQTTEGGGASSGGGTLQRTGGFLALLGIRFIPSIGVLRVALLILVSFVTGYGPIFLLLVGGAIYLGYDIAFNRRLRQLLPLLLTVTLLLGTLAGVMLVFAYDPSYFGIQHYSTLLRFASTSLLMMPLLTAPLFERVASSKAAKIVIAIGMILLYVGSAGALSQAAVTGLDPSDNPLTFSPPVGWHGATIALRNFMIAHPEDSGFVVLGLDKALVMWTPGLGGQPNLSVGPYLNNSALENIAYNRFLVSVDPGALDTLKGSYSLTWQLVKNAIAGNQSAVDGFRATGVVINNDSGTIVTVSRA